MNSTSHICHWLLRGVLLSLAFTSIPAGTLAAPFTDVGGSSGTGDATDDRGIAWGDYDSDGDLDLYLSKNNSPNRLYRNNGNGTFTDVGVASGTNNTGAGRGVSWADYDNDGDSDLYLVNEGSANRLYRNNANGTFTEVGSASSTNNTGSGKGVAWGDYDSDGYVDIYVANYGSANRLYHNNGNGTFTDVGVPSGTGFTANSTGVAWGDYDNDGRLDLYVAGDNLTANNKLYRNNGNGTFTNMATASGTNDSGPNIGVAWGDFDNDGDLDLYMTKYGTANRLFRNNANGTFTDIASSSGTADIGNGTGVTWGDYDNDSDLDLYVVNEGSANRHYRNNGNGTFTEVGAAMSTDDGGNGQGVAWADYDLDGDLDLYLANSLGANRLYRNDSAVPPGNHWLHVNLVGTVSNRSGIGARVRCVAGSQTTIREISGGSGYLSQCSLTAEFGLGTATSVTTLEVRWPSGFVQTVVSPAIDQRITVVEPTLFSEVGATSGTNDSGNAFGNAWGDYDSDGDLDLFISKYGSPNLLYRNNGNGAFTEEGAASGTNANGAGEGVAWGDYDNDGDLDLYQANYGSANRLYRNNGDGTFTDAGAASGTNDTGNSYGVAWGDYDNDGNLDLYVANNNNPNRLYRNNGDGTFTDVAATSGTDVTGPSYAAAWGDYNKDGNLDLYVTSYDGTAFIQNHLYYNNGNGTFNDVSFVFGIDNDLRWSTDADWGDYDNDGDLDLYVVRDFGGANLLFRNDGDFTFTNVGALSGTADAGEGMSAAWGDYDNDGDLDLYLVNVLSQNRLYRNNGNGTFTNAGSASGTNFSGLGTAMAWGDFDNDGDLDIYLVNGYGGTNHLYRNDHAVPAGQHWLHVDLIGTQSNRVGIGARVRCVAGGTSQIREISGGSGLSQCSLTAEFGLGTAATVDSLVVTWPSGLVQVQVNPAIDQRITVTETGTPFVDIGPSSGTGDGGDGAGVAWGDFDNDGDLDLYLSNFGSANRLYRNNGGWVFTEIGAATGINDTGNGHGIAWGDYDNDGDLDLYLGNFGGTNRLYRNNGNGTFAEVGAASGTNDSGATRTVAWGDYNNDGHIDLYLAKENSPNRLYRNNGNGTFTDVAPAAGTDDPGNGTGVAWGDYDSDGDLDLYVANHMSANRLYRNNGDETFTEVGAASGTADIGNGHGVAWGDYDNDGDLDLYLSNLGGGNRLYRNNGNGSFMDVGAASGTNSNANGRGVAWGDFDNDGDLDLYLANETADQLYRNNGNGIFTEIAAASGVADGQIGVGAAWADFDDDGDLDLYLANNGTNRLYMNFNAVPPDHHWLQVNLVGRTSNRSGIGARVRCVAGGASSIREISGGSGYLSQCSLAAEFGLGISAVVDTLEIHWPSGIVQTMANLGVDQKITATEPKLFTDVAVDAGMNDTGMNRSAAWGDYDSDGDLDLYLAYPQGGQLRNRLYQNNGNGTFTDVGAASGTDDNETGTVAWGDYDNDGHLDLFLARGSSGGSRLYRNLGNGTFTNVAAASGTSAGGGAAAWGDYNNDGNLDLYVAATGAANLLYQNLGNGTFAEVGAASGTNSSGSSAAVWGDYDSDGDLDLYVLRSGMTAILYRNNGDETFTDVGASSGTNNAPLIVRSAEWGDYDNDADLDLYVPGFPSSRLYRNNGNGTFMDVAAASGANGDGSGARGVSWGDYDNDGNLDLYLARNGSSRLYRNLGNGTFTDVGLSSGTNADRGYAVPWGDYDNDGDIDLYVSTDNEVNHLYRNDDPVLPRAHWLHADLVGTQSNRAGIGARVRCVAGGRSRIQEISGGTCLTQSSLTAEFGLGAAATVDTLEIRWPSGVVQTLLNPGVDQRITVTEPAPAPFQFTEAGAASGTNDSGPSHGVAWGDYDGDGDLDLYLAQFGGGPNRLYRNNGNGTFTDVAAASGTVGTGSSTAGVWGDYDNDSDLDLYLACRGGANQLFRNNDNGTFTEVGATSGTNDTALARGAAWGDYDNDGYLDLYVANTDANVLYHNLGNGTFAEVGATSGTNDAGDGTGVAWGDYDSDGDLDLAVANYFTPNRLYQNNGNGTFADVTVASGTDFTGPSHGVAWGDYDNDGNLDLYLANHGAANRLYRNNGNGTFTDVGAASGTNDGGLSRGVAWGDFDDDGYLDLFVSNEGVSRLYKNNGNGTFTDVAGAYGVSGSGTVVGVAWADYDQDGDLDLYVAVYDGVNRLYRNDNVPLVANHWLSVDLVGTESNRAGIGARVRCVAGGNRRIREISGGSGYLSQEPLTARFGLGLTAAVDTLEIRWPSGIVQVLTNPAIDQRLTVTEQQTSSSPDTAPLPQEYSLYANVPNPFNPATVIGFDLPSPGAVQLTVIDVAGRPVRKLLSGTEHPAGHHQVTWDGRSDQGNSVASGIYFYRIVANDFRATRRMTLLK